MAGTDTGIEILYGDSSVTTSTQNPTGVWDSNFVMVQHLQETSGTHFDSTGSSPANDGTNSGSNQNATGKIDGANDFIDSGDIRITDKASLDITGPITVEAWVNLNNLAATFDYVVAKSDIGNNGRSYSLYYNVDVPSFDFSEDGTFATIKIVNLGLRPNLWVETVCERPFIRPWRSPTLRARMAYWRLPGLWKTPEARPRAAVRDRL